MALENEGYTNTKGSTKWSTGAIRYILSNEKYKGCSEAQKTVTINGIEKRNNGFSEKYYMENTHEPIISPDDFEKVQVLLRERSSSKLKGKKGHEKYPFAGKVECECCGNKFNHKINNTNKSWRTGIWLCSHQNNYGKKVCNSSRIKDNILEEKFIEAFNEFIKEKKESNSVVVLKTMLEQLVGDERTLTSYKVNHLINEEEYKKEVAEIRKEIKDCTNKLEKELRKEIKTDGLKPLESFDKKMVDDYLEKVLVGNYRVTFIFVNGVIITKTYTNGPSGNQKGWKEKQLNRLKGEFGNGNI